MNSGQPERDAPDIPSAQMSGAAAEFGGYRSEWLGPADLLETFTQPFFFPELEAVRPCILEGGRGTGKTTLLKSLAYDAQCALRGQAWLTDRSYVGIYIKIFTGTVRGLQGPELTDLGWQRLFQHYWNLESCVHLLQYARWFASASHSPAALPSAQAQAFCESLGIDHTADLAQLADAVREQLISLERFAANVGSGQAHPSYSSLGRPIYLLVDALRAGPAAAQACVYFLLDEYEALLPYQQQVLNTLIKQSDVRVSFKVGVRELGMRHHGTLNPHEILSDPADYYLFPIAHKLAPQFDEFAAQVCTRRLRRIRHVPHDLDVRLLFPSLPLEEEGRVLGISEPAERLLSAIQREENARVAAGLSDLELAFLEHWCTRRAESVDDALQWIQRHPEKWKQRFDNYSYAFLFTLRKGKRGIRKYYCGWSVITALASGNTRFVLELVYESILNHLAEGGELPTPLSPRAQTAAAQEIARKNLRILEGSSVYGARLSRLMWGLGRLFGKLAEQAVGHSPEINQFEVDYDEHTARSACDELLMAAVEHLALLRLPGTKLLAPSDVQDWDFTPHPLFSPLFVFSHRRKRKLTLRASDIVLFGENPAEAVNRVLRRDFPDNRATAAEDLPDQLNFLADAYGATQ